MSSSCFPSNSWLCCLSFPQLRHTVLDSIPLVLFHLYIFTSFLPYCPFTYEVTHLRIAAWKGVIALESLSAFLVRQASFDIPEREDSFSCIYRRSLYKFPCQSERFLLWGLSGCWVLRAGRLFWGMKEYIPLHYSFICIVEEKGPVTYILDCWIEVVLLLSSINTLGDMHPMLYQFFHSNYCKLIK